MPGKIKSLFYITLLSGLLFTMQANAMLVGGGKFERIIEKAEIVVKAKAVPQKEDGFGGITFTAKVISILKSDGEPIPEHLSLHSVIFNWPIDMGVPFEKEQVVLLVLQRTNKGKVIEVNNSRTILPATNSQIAHKSDSTIQRKIFDELHAYLRQAKDGAFRALVLVHLSCLASKNDEKTFLPYLKSKDERLRQAALASLIRISPTGKRIQSAAADFEKHLSKKPADYRVYKFNHYPGEMTEDQLFWKIYEDVGWVSICGAKGIDRKMTMRDRAKAYLPIYRVLIDKSPADYKGVPVGITALKFVGTRQDVHRLYKKLDHKQEWVRHFALEGIGRILKTEIIRPNSSYGTPQMRPDQIVEWEKRAQNTIKKAMIKEGLLEK